MKPLETSQRILTLYCIRPDDPSTKWREARLAFVCFLLISVSSCEFSSILFFMKYVSIDFNAAIFSLLQIAIYFGLFYTMIVVIYSRSQITGIFDKLTDIYDSYENEESFKYLEEATNTGEKLFPSYIRLVMIGLFSVYVAATAASVPLQLMLTHIFDVKNLVHMQMLLLPWDSTTPNGYFWEIILSTVYIETYYTVNGPVLLVFVSICLHNEAFEKMFASFVRKMDDLQDKGKEKQQLAHIIRFNMMTRNWLKETVDVYSPFLLIQMICLTMYLACSVFQLDFLFGLFVANLNLTVFVFVIRVLFGTATLFTFCYFGKLSTTSFEKTADDLIENKWYSWNVSSQKYIVTMMISYQRPIYYHGFGVALLNLETFSKLIKSVVTYYLAFKTLDT